MTVFEKEEYFNYLDTLRESGECNMFESSNYLMTAFNLERKDAREIVKEWMQNYGQR